VLKRANRSLEKALRPNKPLKLTPLCGLKIGAILKFVISQDAFPVYRAAQLSARALGCASNTALHSPSILIRLKSDRVAAEYTPLLIKRRIVAVT
jgi:hypothetical protein